MDARIIALARRQLGLVARRQLLELGCSPGQVDGLVRRGVLERFERGVHLVAGSPIVPLTPVLAATLRAGVGARAVGERLLAAQGVRDAEVEGGFAILVPPGRRLTRFPALWRPDRHPGLGIAATVQGVPSYDACRNLLEAAVDAPDGDRVRHLADGLRRVRRDRLRRLADLCFRHLDHPGARRLLLLGCLDADAAESDPERFLEVLLDGHRFERQVVVVEGIRVDFLLPDLRVVVEYDGEADHRAQVRRREARSRDAVLRALGYRVERVTSSDLHDPAALLARILGTVAVD